MPQTQPTDSLVVDPKGQGFLSQRVSLWYNHNHNHNHKHNHYNNYHRDTAGIRNPSCWPSASPWSRLVDVESSGAVSWPRSGWPCGGRLLRVGPQPGTGLRQFLQIRRREPAGDLIVWVSTAQLLAQDPYLRLLLPESAG